VHLTHLVHHTGIEENPFGGCGFAGIDVSGNTNISDAFEWEGAGHGVTAPKRVDKKRASLYRLAGRRVGRKPDQP
jgi:hypothetical protein